MMLRLPAVAREIAGLRVRRSFTGKLVLQVRRRLSRVYPPMPGSDEAGTEEPAGFGPWKDANGNDAKEVYEVLSLLSDAEGG